MLILMDLIFFKMAKKGVFFPQESRADVARDPRGCDMARKATWQGHAGPRERLRGAKVARTRGKATRVHADARVVPRGRESGLRVMGPRV